MLNIKHSLFFVLSFLLTACVTINVYFPAAAAEKAADQIIDNVWGKEQKESEPTKPVPENEKKPESKNEFHQYYSPPHWLTNWMSFFITEAHAGVNLDIFTPAIQALQERMADRHKELKQFYDKGAIGLTHHALITVRNLTLVPLKWRTKVNRWVQEENQDRLNLYYQIAVANDHPEWKDEIRAIFARRWIERAQHGWWYQDDKERWQQKR